MTRAMPIASAGAAVWLAAALLLVQNSPGLTTGQITNPGTTMQPAAQVSPAPQSAQPVAPVGAPLQPNDLGYTAGEPNNRPVMLRRADFRQRLN